MRAMCIRKVPESMIRLERHKLYPDMTRTFRAVFSVALMMLRTQRPFEIKEWLLTTYALGDEHSRIRDVVAEYQRGEGTISSDEFDPIIDEYSKAVTDIHDEFVDEFSRLGKFTNQRWVSGDLIWTVHLLPDGRSYVFIYGDASSMKDVPDETLETLSALDGELSISEF